MAEIQGKSILVRVSARFELARVRVIGSRLYLVMVIGLSGVYNSRSNRASNLKSAECVRSCFPGVSD